jgi:hypothetical protein
MTRSWFEPLLAKPVIEDLAVGGEGGPVALVGCVEDWDLVASARAEAGVECAAPQVPGDDKIPIRAADQQKLSIR